MANQTPETLNHFALITFTRDYNLSPPTERQARLIAWLDSIRRITDALHLYQVKGLESHGELMLWCACESADPARVQQFFNAWIAAASAMRGLIELQDVLWGFTRPSQYTKARSTQDLDPFSPARHPYLIVYPFVKTAGWYQLDREERQRLMTGHIRIGTQYKDISQLLLYSFGVQDQEFVVVYETADLRRFLGLVHELRSAEGRIYTQRDSPLHTGVYQTSSDLAAWL
jgi:chlorite dismutase